MEAIALIGRKDMTRALAVIIVVLAAIDGLVHLGLDVFVLHGIFSHPPLTILFLLNFLGYAALIIAFLALRSSSLSLRRLVDVLLIVYPLVTFAAWIYFTGGKANPLGLADISKPAEVLLAVAAILHLTQLGHEEAPGMSRSHAT